MKKKQTETSLCMTPSCVTRNNNFVNRRTEVTCGCYLALINRGGGLYGRIFTEVVSTDRTQ